MKSPLSYKTQIIYCVCLILLVTYLVNVLFDKRYDDPESKIWDKIYVTDEAKKWAPDALDYSEKVITSLQKGDQSEVLKLFENEGVRTQPPLSEIVQYFQGSEILSEKVARFSMHIAYKDPSDKIFTIQYLLKLKKDSNVSWCAITTEIHKQDNLIMAQNLQAFPITDDFIDNMSFSLDVGLLNYLMFFFALMITAFDLWVIFIWFQIKMKWKWLWLPLILFGISFFTFNWSSGVMDFSNISFGVNLPGAKFMKGSAFSPWILLLYIPVGSLIFLSKIKFWNKNKTKTRKL